MLDWAGEVWWWWRCVRWCTCLMMMPSVKETTLSMSTTSDVESGVAPSRLKTPPPSGQYSPCAEWENKPGVSTVRCHSQMSLTRRTSMNLLWSASNGLAMNVSVRYLSK